MRLKYQDLYRIMRPLEISISFLARAGPRVRGGEARGDTKKMLNLFGGRVQASEV